MTWQKGKFSYKALFGVGAKVNCPEETGLKFYCQQRSLCPFAEERSTNMAKVHPPTLVKE